MQTDFIQSFLINDWDLRGHIVRLGSTLRDIISQHAYPLELSQFLGQMLTSTCLLTASIKFSGQITLQMQSDGLVKLLVAKSDHHFNLRGLAQWDENALPKNLNDAIGEGKLVVTISLDNSTQPYQSIIELRDRDLVKSLQHYFLQSEQIPTKLWLIADDKEAFGVMIQALPNPQQEKNWQQALQLWNTFQVEQLREQSNEHLFADLANLCQLQLFEPRPVQFQCHCNMTRMQNALLSIGYTEALDILNDQQVIIVTCEYCSQEYEFNRTAIEALFHNT
ncbi:MAG: Hsp33 family molecular chaperone HslO [Legionellales bacterium]|nr:Hsp33 family molecular chaperone HslO [Legionellales bacterium]